MDRSRIFAAQHSAAVRTAGSAALHLLLSAAAGDRGEPAPDAPVRRVVPEMPVLREPQDGLRAAHQSQTRATADADSGHRSPLSQTELEPPGTGSQDLPVSAARRGNPPAQPRLEHRYYLHSDAWRLSGSGRGDGLVQPLRAQLGTVQHHGDRLLPGRASGGIPLRPTRNLELRSGFAVHCGRLPGSAEEARGLTQYGWPRSRTRQCFHRTPVALFEVRTDLSRRLRHRPRTVSGPGKLLPLLQSPAAAPGSRLSDAGRSVPAQGKKEKVTLIMGAPPPSPRDLALLFSRMDAFRFTRNGACRTIETLARRIGLSRDGTRAPMQVRNGWRPSGRRSDQPAAPSKNGRFFVQLMGSTSGTGAGSVLRPKIRAAFAMRQRRDLFAQTSRCAASRSRVFISANRRFLDAHFAPVVGKLFPAFQTHDIGAGTHRTGCE